MADRSDGFIFPPPGEASDSTDEDDFSPKVSLQWDVADYAMVYGAIAGVLAEFEPRLLILSAGFDAHANDPLASMRMSAYGFAAVIAILKGAIACPIAAVTEGGYDLDALHECVSATIDALSASGAGPTAVAGNSERAARALDAVAEAQGQFWSTLRRR